MSNTDEKAWRESQDTQTGADHSAGMPGDGAGRREDVRGSGVYPVSEDEGASPDAPIRDEASWGQGERGAEGYNDSGDSEI